MAEQPENETTLHKTLYILVRRLDLSPEQVAQLRLSDLHLAGKHPTITFTPAGHKESETVELDLDAHRALVGWLVSRPDSVSDLLFPGSDAEGLDPVEIEQVSNEMAEEEEAQVDEGEETEAEAEPIASDEPETPPEAAPPSPENEPTTVTGSRPVPPLSRPEMGTPPRRPDDTTPPPPRTAPPPPSAPEEDPSVNIPLPSAGPTPPTSRPVRPPEAERPPAKPARRTAREPKETPPRGAESKPTPVTPDKAEGEVPPRVAKPDRARSQEPTELKADSSPAEKAAADSGPSGVEKAGEQEKKMPTVGRPESRAASGKRPSAEAASRPVAKQKGKPSAEEVAEQTIRSDRTSSVWPRLVIPATVTVVLLLCGVCVGGGWFAWQSVADTELLAGLGLSPEALEGDILEPGEDGTADAVVFESPVSPLATPTLPATATATPLPATDTPVATLTGTSTPVPTETATPVPTDTPLPTDTPTPEAPANTPTPEEPTASPTPAMKYGAPVLLEPEDGFEFIAGNTIVLRWQSVGELAPNEQYAVRLRYRYNDEITYQGTNLKETAWTVPLSLYGQVDPPENRYEWWVVVERLNEDGSGTAISPQSEIRTFIWK